MARKINDSTLKNYLAKTSKPELIAWLMERCQQDERLRASLLDLVTPKEDAKALTSEIRSRIRKAWQLSKRKDGWKMALPISRELDQVLTSIWGLMDKDCLTEAEKLLVVFIQAAEKGMAHIDDSYGYLWPTCQQGVTLWGQVWARIEPRDSKELAELVYGQIHHNDCAVKDDMILKFAEALGEAGLRALQWRLKGDLAALPQPDSKAKFPDFGRVQVAGWLEEIADALGDVDEYIAIVESEQQVKTYALPVARRLFEAARLQEALAFLEKGTGHRGFHHGEPYDYPTLKTKILAGLGRGDEARETLWKEFATYLSVSTFESILEMTPEVQQAQARARAVSLAEHHRSPEQAAYFLVRLDELQRAASLVEEKQGEISGSMYDVLLKVAQALTEPHPAQAWILYKALTINILDEGRYKAYPHAARYLMRMEELADTAGIQPHQAEFVTSLRQAHGRKSSFWAKVKTHS